MVRVRGRLRFVWQTAYLVVEQRNVIVALYVDLVIRLGQLRRHRRRRHAGAVHAGLPRLRGAQPTHGLLAGE